VTAAEGSGGAAAVAAVGTGPSVPTGGAVPTTAGAVGPAATTAVGGPAVDGPVPSATAFRPSAATAGAVGPAPASLGHLRLRFTKLGKLRWIGHRDVARLWERVVRRAGLPVAYSGGFSPHPLLSFGLALPTGCESVAEYVDVALVPPSTAVADGTADPAWAVAVAATAPEVLAPHLPDGITVVGAAAVAADCPSLQQAVTSCTWRIAVEAVAEHDVAAAVTRAVSAPQLVVARERKGRRTEEDLRPALLDLRLARTEDEEPPLLASCTMAGDPLGRTDQPDPRSVLVVETATRPRGVRPSELAEALGLPLGLARRTHQWIDCDGTRREPLDVRPAPALVASGGRR
jgi:hypothetical protein